MTIEGEQIRGWAFYAYGHPAPQGSKSPKGRTKSGRIILVESSKAVKPWREEVALQARLQIPRRQAPLDGPLIVRMVFTLPRPKAARKADWAPYHYPDLSKLARATEDAITAAGLWADDARVIDYIRLAKVWAGFDDQALPEPGVVVACVETGQGLTRWAAEISLQNIFNGCRARALVKSLPARSCPGVVA